MPKLLKNCQHWPQKRQKLIKTRETELMSESTAAVQLTGTAEQWCRIFLPANHWFAELWPTHHCCPCCRSVGARGPHVAWPSVYAGWRQYDEITGRGGWRPSRNAWSRPRQSHPPRHLTTLARCCTGPLSRRLVWTAKLSCDDLTPSWHQAVRAPPDGWRPCCWLSEAYSVLEGGYVLTAAATAAGGIMPSSTWDLDRPRSSKLWWSRMSDHQRCYESTHDPRATRPRNIVAP